MSVSLSVGGATGAGPGYQIAGIPQVAPSVLAEGVLGAVPGSPFQPHNRPEAATLWLRGWSGPLSSLLAGVPKGTSWRTEEASAAARPGKRCRPGKEAEWVSEGHSHSPCIGLAVVLPGHDVLEELTASHPVGIKGHGCSHFHFQLTPHCRLWCPCYPGWVRKHQDPGRLIFRAQKSPLPKPGKGSKRIVTRVQS